MPKPRPRVYIDVVQNLQKATRRGVDFNLVFHVGALLLSRQLPPPHTHTHTHTHTLTHTRPGHAGFQSSRYLMRRKLFSRLNSHLSGSEGTRQQLH